MRGLLSLGVTMVVLNVWVAACGTRAATGITGSTTPFDAGGGADGEAGGPAQGGSGAGGDGGVDAATGVDSGGSPADAGAEASCSAGGPYDASVLGQPCPSDCTAEKCCDPAFAQACEAAGGFMEHCQWAAGCWMTPGQICFPPPPPPTPAGFGCAGQTCAVGQVCVHSDPSGDGCTSSQCAAPPAACASDLTCTCLGSNWLLWENAVGFESCSVDAAGNPTVHVAY
jgi:hypothetical protein